MEQEKIDCIEEAQALLFEAIELIESVFGGDGYVENYLIAPLKIIASSDHGYLTRDPNLTELIERLRNDESDED